MPPVLSKFTDSRPAPPDAATWNSQVWGRDLPVRLARIAERDNAGVLFTSASETLSYLFALEPLIDPADSARHITGLQHLVGYAGSLTNDRAHCTIAKVLNHVLGYSVVCVPQATRNTGLITGAVLGTEQLMGTSFLAADGADQQQYVLQSIPNAFFVHFGMTCVTGTFQDTATCESFARLGDDHATWVDLLEKAKTQRAQMEQIFINIRGEERDYVAPIFDAALWRTDAPAVSIEMCLPEDIPAAFDAVKARLGCDTYAREQAASQRRAVEESVREALAQRDQDAQNANPPAPAQAAMAAASRPVEIVDGRERAQRDTLVALKAQFTALFMCGFVSKDFKIEGTLSAPRWTDAMESFFACTNGAQRAQELGIAWNTILKGDDDDDDDANAALANDPQRLWLSLFHVVSTLVKLVATCSFTTNLVDRVDQANPAVDLYHFMGQPLGDDTVARAAAADQYQANEEAVGQNEHHIQKRKLAAAKLGSINQYDDVIRLCTNLCSLILVCCKLDGPPESKPILYQLLQLFISYLLRGSVRAWATKFRSQHPQLNYYSARQVEVAFKEICGVPQNWTALNRIKGNQLALVSTHPYLRALDTFKRFKSRIQGLVSEDQCLTLIPTTCPDELNPRSIQHARAVRDAAAQRNANAYNGGGRGGGGRNDGGRGGGRGDNGRGDNGRGEGGRGAGARGVGRGGDGGRGDGGRGAGRGGGRGGGRGAGRGSRHENLSREERGRMSGSFYARQGVTPSLPTNTSQPYCAPWMFKDLHCSAPYGTCDGMHFNFDAIPVAGDKTAIEQHIADTEGLWFNQDICRTVSDANRRHLGNANGPTGE